jgi:AcrR family transcriptional regulator
MQKPAKRPRRTPQDARRLILDTARELLVDTGPEGLRLQEIATRAGISHPLILHHFGSREGLVRALTQEAAAELRDRLIAAIAAGEASLERQLDRVFDAFRDGLAQRLAWLATVEREREGEASATIMRDIGDVVHARRLAAAPPGTGVSRADTNWLIHLVAAAAFGDAVFGPQLRRSAGLPAANPGDRGFREWFAALIRDHVRGAGDDKGGGAAPER